MIAQRPEAFSTRENLRVPSAITTSTAMFDWAYGLLVLLGIAGVWLDIWSHSRFGPDQSVFNEYHLLFYSAVATLGGFLAYVGIGRIKAGVPWRRALPLGYAHGAVGVILFAVAGGLDLAGHALFGFETGVEAIISPTHQALFVSAVLIGSGPLRAVLARTGPGKQAAWEDAVPLVVGTVAVITGVTWGTLPFLPLSGGTVWPVQAARVVPDQLAYSLGILGVYLQTAIVVGVVLWILRRITPPIGFLTITFGLFAVLALIRTRTPELLPVWLAAGVFGDGLRVVLRPSSSHPWRFRLLGFLLPIVLWSSYYGLLFATGLGGGVWFTGYVWLGSVIQAGLVGFLVSLLLLPSTFPHATDEGGTLWR
jgi:hypothetical protein